MYAVSDSLKLGSTAAVLLFFFGGGVYEASLTASWIHGYSYFKVSFRSSLVLNF